jgi:hypothetical protein
VKGTLLTVAEKLVLDGEPEVAYCTAAFSDHLVKICRDGVADLVEDAQEEKDVEMEFQDAKRALKAVCGHSDSESNDNERRKALHVMFRGSWDITSRRIIKALRREIAAAAPAPKAVPHRKWMKTPIGFDTSGCPMSMAGAR